MTTTVVEVPLPDELVKAIDEAAKIEQQTRTEFLQEAAARYMSERRWKRIQEEVSVRALEAGIYTEDDVEDFLDSISE